MNSNSLQLFGEFVNQYNWSTVLTAVSTDAKVDKFLKVTQYMIVNYFPEKTLKLHDEGKFFITAKIKRLTR